MRYDESGNVTEGTAPDSSTTSYTYDPVGNMLTKTVGGVKTQYSYNAANQLVSDGENRYAYDANGNLTQKGNVSYAYNALNLLQSWTDGEHSETYTYNANGLLNTITNAEGTTSLTWDILMGDGVVIAANTNGVETNYTYGLERISAQTGNRKTEYIYDGRGSVAAEVSYNNAWYTFGGAFSKKDVISKSYTPFGEQIGEQVSGFGYNGEYYNAATGMVYLRARFYEPAMNRFSQKDIVRGSITAPNSLNRYTYVQNDPINFIDPSGEKLMSTLSNAWNSVKNFFTGGSSKPAPAAPSKPAASSTGSKTSATSANTAGTAAKKSTTSSATAYAGSSSGTNRVQSPGPVQSTAQNVNPYNVAQSTAQAVADARKAADYMNATAPGSPAAQQATRAYMETQRLASMANATHDPNIARQAVQASQASVNHTNNVATGRSPNTYTPYNSNGNATSYFNSSYQSGKAPSPDAPRIEDVTGDSVQYCSTADRIANIQAFGAGDYSGISAAIGMTVDEIRTVKQSIKNYLNEKPVNGIGLSGVFGLGAMLSGSIMYVWDQNGNRAIAISLGGGGGAGASVGATVSFDTSIENISDLKGLDFKMGVTAILVGVESDETGESVSSSIWKPSLGGEFHFTANYTWIIQLGGGTSGNKD